MSSQFFRGGVLKSLDIHVVNVACEMFSHWFCLLCKQGHDVSIMEPIKTKPAIMMKSRKYMEIWLSLTAK